MDIDMYVRLSRIPPVRAKRTPLCFFLSIIEDVQKDLFEHVRIGYGRSSKPCGEHS